MTTSLTKTQLFYYLLILHHFSLLLSFRSISIFRITTSVATTTKFPIFPLKANSADDEMKWDPKAAPKLDFNEDLYSVLEVSEDCTPQELKKKYLKLVFQYHPDNKEDEASKKLCNRQMMVINGAYKILKDPTTRADYDSKRRIRATQSGSSSQSARTPPKKSRTPNKQYYDSYSNDDFYKNYVSSKEKDMDVATESLGDIFAEIWTDVRRNGGEKLLKDLTDFLDDQIAPDKTSAYTQDAKYYTAKSLADIEADIKLKSTVLSNLKTHIAELKLQKSTVEATLVWQQVTQPPSASSTTTTTAGPGPGPGTATPDAMEELQRKLQLIESLRGLEARLSEANKQQLQLERQIRKAREELQYRNRSGSTSNPSQNNQNNNNNNNNWKSRENSESFKTSNERERYTNNSYNTAVPPPSPSSRATRSTTTTTSDKVEEELNKLKKQMGLR